MSCWVTAGTPRATEIVDVSLSGRRLAWTTNRGGGREGQIFLADWNHEAALAAVRGAPDRN